MNVQFEFVIEPNLVYNVSLQSKISVECDVANDISMFS